MVGGPARRVGTLFIPPRPASMDEGRRWPHGDPTNMACPAERRPRGEPTKLACYR